MTSLEWAFTSSDIKMRIAIEGLIGVGKSTVLNQLAGQGYRVELEPLSDWSLLQQFYANQHANATAFEAQVLASYCHNKFSNPDMLMERSPDTAFGVFATMLHQQGRLEGSGMALLRHMYSVLPIYKADAFVYIHAPVDVCLARMQWRNRGSESGVGPEYLDQLNTAYKHFFIQDSRPHVFVSLNGKESPTEVADMVQKAIVRLTSAAASHHVVFVRGD